MAGGGASAPAAKLALTLAAPDSLQGFQGLLRSLVPRVRRRPEGSTQKRAGFAAVDNCQLLIKQSA